MTSLFTVQPIDEEILTLLLNTGRSLSITDISTKLHHGRHTIARYLDNLLHTGKVCMRQHGLKKKFYIPAFVPPNSIETFSPHIQIVLKKDYTILQVNDQFLQLVRTTKESVIGLNLGLLHTDIFDVKRIIERMQTIKEGESLIFEDSMHMPGKRSHISIYRLPILISEPGIPDILIW